MLGHSHVVIACATWAAVWWRPVVVGDAVVTAPQAVLGADFPPLVASLVAVSFGALLPDIDHPQALLAQWKPAGKGGPLGLWRFFRPLVLPAAVVRETLGHRGALHSLVCCVVIATGVEYLSQVVGAPGIGAALGWGYAAHLLADMATRRGIPLLWPLTRRRIGFPRPVTVRTGGFGEAIYLCLTGAAAALYASGALALPHP
jgi:inner membrane protein